MMNVHNNTNTDYHIHNITESSCDMSFLIKNKVLFFRDLNKFESIMLVPLAFFVIFFGFYPVPLMETFSISVNNLIDNYINHSYIH